MFTSQKYILAVSDIAFTSLKYILAMPDIAFTSLKYVLAVSGIVSVHKSQVHPSYVCMGLECILARPM